MTEVFLNATGSVFGQSGWMKIQVAGGPLSLQIGGGEINLLDLYKQISGDLDSLFGFSLPDLTGGPWGLVFGKALDITVQPTLWIAPGTNTAMYFELEFSQPVHIGGAWPSEHDPIITLEPNIEVLGFYIGYDKSVGGIDFRAKIATNTTPTPNGGNGTKALTAGSPPGKKTQLVSYPFPIPPQGSVSKFKLNYLGLGQRVGPTYTINPNDPGDPMAEIFEILETQLNGDDPTTVLTTLARTFYHPDRNWFIAAHLTVVGWDLKVLFNDPVLYGLELTAPASPPTFFSGLLIEILYEKLGPNLGVYYGALNLPEIMRRIDIDGVILILPGFAIWVYTNGDFRVNVGWPLGNESIGVQVSVLIGRAGFYFAKLRSSDDPGAKPSVNYNPILEFGLAITVFAQESVNDGIFSASLSVTVSASFQGLLAWKEGNSTAGPPDHLWIAATASLAVLLQGTVDFAIISASVSVSFTASVGFAMETGYGTILAVSADVDVSVSVKVVFFTIHLHFSATISHTFTIGSAPWASVNGPQAPGLLNQPVSAQATLHAQSKAAARTMLAARFAAAAPLAASRPMRIASLASALSPTARARMIAAVSGTLAQASVASPGAIDLFFVLQPTAVYTGNTPSICAVATLLIESPVPGSSPSAAETPFEQLVQSLVVWLLALPVAGTGSPLSAQFAKLNQWLGTGRSEPGNFASEIQTFLETVTFRILPMPATAQETPAAMALFPVFKELELSAPGLQQPVDFSKYNPTPANYTQALAIYFEELGLSSSEPDATSTRAERFSALLGNAPLTGPSMATLVEQDYFLLIARQAISSLYKAALAYENQKEASLATAPATPVELALLISSHVDSLTAPAELTTLLAEYDYVSSAGMVSRFLLQGLQLPDPSLVPGSPLNWDTLVAVHTDGLYTLTGQQFAVAGTATTVEASLSIGPSASPPHTWIGFEGAGGSPATGVTSELALPAAVPPKPSPVWLGGSSPSGGADNIRVTPLPAVVSHPYAFALKSQVAWDAPGAGPTFSPPDKHTLLLLPEPLTNLVAANGGAQLELSTKAPPDQGSPFVLSPGNEIAATPALLIRLNVSQVEQATSINVGPSGSPSHTPSGSPGAPGNANPYVPFVYQLGAADEPTRELIYEALQAFSSPAPQVAITLLYTSPTTKTLRSDPLSPHVLLAKTNLSTLNQVQEVANAHFLRMTALDANGDGPDWALLTNPQSFLRLVWECSVVNAPGYFLYYQTSDGLGLPAEIFSGGQAAEFDILVQFARLPAQLVPVAAYENVLWIEGGAPAGAVYANVLDRAGHPVPQFQPGYPAGNIGFQVEWQEPTATVVPPAIPIENLYHLIQYALLPSGSPNPYGSSIWSMPVGPQNGAGSSPGDWKYQHAVPIARFLLPEASPAAPVNRYRAIGKPVELQFRLIDLYGNELPDTHAFAFPVLYNDPLASLGEWPGVTADHYFAPVSGGSAALLSIDLVFNASAVVASPVSPHFSPSADDTSSAQLKAAIARFELISDQLNDPNTETMVKTTLAGGGSPHGSPMAGPVGDPVQLKRGLQSFVAAVLQQLRNAIPTNSPDGPPAWPSQPVTASLPIEIPFALITGLDDDILPLGVFMEFSRPTGLVDPVALQNLPGAAQISYPVATSLLWPEKFVTSPPSKGGLRLYAQYFERAFQGFDGAAGILKLAQRSGVHTGDGSSSAPALWAVRWSEKNGIQVQMEGADSLVYFALPPLSTVPFSGPVDGKTYSGVDLDAWARQFLAAFDAFLAPQLAVAIALLDRTNGTGYFDALAAAKESLAQKIPQNLAYVFQQQTGGGAIADAQERLQQALLTALSNAYSVTTVAQVPAQVTIAGSIENPSPATGYPPRLFGTVAPPGQHDGSKLYTLSNAELELVQGGQWLTTMVSVSNPTAQTELSLPLGYQVSYLQHDFEPGEEYAGYVPSSWLKFILPGAAPLDLAITASPALVEIPVPLRSEPTAPALLSQTAAPSAFVSPIGSPGNIQQEIADALRWDYRVQVAHTWVPQDELYFTVVFNGIPPGSPGTGGMRGAPPLTLFEALARFQAAYPALSANFRTIIQEAFPGVVTSPNPHASPGGAAEIIGQFTKLAQAVATAWPTPETLFKAALAVGDRAELRADFYLEVQEIPPGSGVQYLILNGKAPDGSNPTLWPEVTLQGSPSQPWTPTASEARQSSPPDWWTVQVKLSTLSNLDPDSALAQLTFAWNDCAILQQQTGDFSAYVVRNADLDPVRQTNPAFVYQTEVVRFNEPLVPLIERDRLQLMQPEAGLVDTLEQILDPIFKAAQGLSAFLRVQVNYAYVLVPGPSGGGISVTTPVLLADDIELDATGSPATTVSQALGQEIGKWFGSALPSTAGSELDLAITLFATVDQNQLPLVQLNVVPIDVHQVSRTWWTT